MRTLLLLLLLAAPLSAQEPKWIDFQPVTARYGASGTYADVMNHSRESFHGYDTFDTTAHETLHGIHSFLRNRCGGRRNAVYVGGNRSLLLDEPAIRISHVRSFIPSSLRGSRFQLYLVQQCRWWDNEPLYILDEGVAYLMGARAGLECDTGKQVCDIMVAPLEFSVYAAALGLAVKTHCPDYWRTQPDFKAFLRYYTRESLTLYRKGIKVPRYAWKSDLYANLRDGKDAEPIRRFWRDDLGLKLGEVLP